MNQFHSNLIANGAPIVRQEVINLLRAARLTKEHRFARRLAEQWLEVFPGDLGIALLNAEAQAFDKRSDLAVPTLKRLANFDPEFVEAHLLLANLSADSRGFDRMGTLGNIAFLTEKLANLPELPAWTAKLIDMRAQLHHDSIDQIIRELEELIATEPPSPLPALFGLQILTGAGNWPAAFQWAETSLQRWPDSLPFRLSVAEGLMKTGQAAHAVEQLHAAAADDITAQVAIRLWGAEFPYRAIWSQDLRLPVNIPIPAAVAAAMGWNQLTPGNGSILVSKKQKGGRAQPRIQSESKEALISIQEELNRLAQSLEQPDLAGADGRFPALVLLSSRAGLTNKYGASNYETILTELHALADATRKTGRWGAHMIIVDDPQSTGADAINPVPNLDPWATKNLLRDLDASLEPQGERIGALLIIGGHDIIPFHLLPNPVDDDDLEVPSDNPYATLDENYFIPAWPTGRLATGKESSPELLLKQIRSITAHRLSSQKSKRGISRMVSAVLGWINGANRSQSIGMSAEVWQRPSHAVFRTIGKPGALAISPPLQADSSQGAYLNRKGIQLGYFNLHGLSDSPEWFGQRDPFEKTESPDYPIALRPQDILNSGRAPKIVFSESCYGAHIFDKATEEALSLKFLASGTQTLIGSTCISYGSVTTPLIAADLLGRLFWTHLREGYPAGEALRRAKINLAREMDRRQGYLDGEDQKTLISFVLYGDPLVSFDPSVSTPKATLREQVSFTPKAICDKRQSGEELQPLPEEALRQVKSIVGEYLPGMRGAKMSYTHEHLTCIGHDCPMNHLHAKSKPSTPPDRRVVTLTKQIPSHAFVHKQVARLTLGKDGEVVKMAVSR